MAVSPVCVLFMPVSDLKIYMGKVVVNNDSRYLLEQYIHLAGSAGGIGSPYAVV
jgi:hypothetical protein